MPILGITTSVTGLVGISPRIVYITTNDTFATVTATGYLNNAVQEGFSFSPGDLALVGTTSTGLMQDLVSNWFQIIHTPPNWTLLADINPGSVVLPTVANTIAGFTNTAGQIGVLAGTTLTHTGAISITTTITAGTGITSTTGNIVATAGNHVAGSNGVAGLITSFPASANNGILNIQAVNNANNFTTTIRNSAIAQATNYILPDAANATAKILVGATNTPFTSNHSLVASGTAGLVADAGYQLKTVAQAAVAGGAAAQIVVDAFCTAASMVTASWNDTTIAVTIQTVAAGIGQFTVTSSADPGASHLNYIITKV